MVGTFDGLTAHFYKSETTRIQDGRPWIQDGRPWIHNGPGYRTVGPGYRTFGPGYRTMHQGSRLVWPKEIIQPVPTGEYTPMKNITSQP